MINSLWRGHPIIIINDECFYKDTKESTIDSERPCGHCSLNRTKEDHDRCLGTLPGVINACCGHGVESEAYVQFNKDNCIRGLEALNWVQNNKDRE